MVARLRVKLKKALEATVRKHWHLERMKDEGTAMNYRCEIDTAIVAEKQESADVNGRWKHLKSTVIKDAELTLGHKTTEEVRKPWVTDEMIDMMKERRKWKSISAEGHKKYISLNNHLRWITDKDREILLGRLLEVDLKMVR